MRSAVLSTAEPEPVSPPASRATSATPSSLEDSFWSQVATTPANGAPPPSRKEPPPESRTAPVSVSVAAKGPPVDIEAVAIESNFLPVKLPRSTCSIPAETLLRTLGRNPRSADPWVPVGTVGPLLIVAHYRTD
ncbi:MAG TPA: hypothetical protein VHM91_08330, partial [Verrucomicrobiales bacterium]|nr:hypothetical protein [Verrucomicrobiales bacterium]